MQLFCSFLLLRMLIKIFFYTSQFNSRLLRYCIFTQLKKQQLKERQAVVRHESRRLAVQQENLEWQRYPVVAEMRHNA
jgi:hypothetical protein